MTQTLGVIGIGLGLLAGVLIVPPLAGLFTGTARFLVALTIIILCPALVGAAGELLGRRWRGHLVRIGLGKADAVTGVAVGVVAAIFGVWVLGTLLSASRYSTLNGALQESHVLRAVDRVLPPLPELFAKVESFLSDRGFPEVFANLPPGLVAPAQLPDDTAIQAAFAVSMAVVAPPEEPDPEMDTPPGGRLACRPADRTGAQRGVRVRGHERR